MLGTFHVIFPSNEITQAEPCKLSKRTTQLQQCQFSATALNSIKVTAQLHNRVKTTSGLNPFTTDELVEDTSKTCQTRRKTCIFKSPGNITRLLKVKIQSNLVIRS